MSYLTLDLSTKCSGWAKFTKDGKLIKHGRISPDNNLSLHFKNHFITEKLTELFRDVDTVVIEDIYYGKNVLSLIALARISGAVIEKWIGIKFKDPVLYKAISARPLAGISARSHKAEIQIFIIEKYKFASKKLIKEWEEKIIELKEELKNKTLTKGQFKYRLNKMSDIIDAETSMGEDNCDAILLGIAHTNKLKGLKK